MADFTLDVTEVEAYAARMREVSTAGATSFAGIANKYRDLTMMEARRIVPVDTGALRHSIQPVPGEASRTGLNANWIVGEGYAGFVEYGTARMAAQPYVRPALKKFRKPYVEELAAAAKEGFIVNKSRTRTVLKALPVGVTQPRGT